MKMNEKKKFKKKYLFGNSLGKIIFKEKMTCYF